MSAVGGPVQEVSINNRLFTVAADAQGDRKLGGYEKELAMNGNGSHRYLMSRVGWSFNGLTLVCDDERGDQEFLQDVANKPSDVVCAFTLVSGDTYEGAGSVIGELTFNTQNSTCTANFGGGGEMAKQ